jgi:predicted nucleotidyltransferase
MGIEQKYFLRLKELVINFLKDREVKIILFGSRARGQGSPFSDVDIGIIPFGELEDKELAILRERIEDSNIPYKVEVVNFSEVSEDFKKSALKEAIVWKD